MICLLRIDGCWCGPRWPSLAALTCAVRFRAANLLAYFPLRGGLALILLEETLNVLLLCLTLSPFNFFTQNSVK